MNSDPHESAAWRTFGMLDADEATGFDEAMQHDPELRAAYREMDSLATAVAVVATVPVAPRAGQLERLHARLGLNVSKHTNWLGISGWAAAAALTMVLVIEKQSSKAVTVVANPSTETRISNPKIATTTAPAVQANEPEPDEQQTARQDDSPSDAVLITGSDIESKPIVKVETKRLIQEIEVLRDKLETIQERDRKRFEPIAGMAWPIVMRMMPPGTIADSSNDLLADNETPPMTAILGDALTASNMAGAPHFNIRAAEQAAPAGKPSAIPIYDAARDTGTLVVSNLPAKLETERYNLWVKTDEGGAPVYVGRLPESNNVGTEPFDFSLGSTGIVPSGFVLTRDGQGDPVIPTAANTVLQGPN